MNKLVKMWLRGVYPIDMDTLVNPNKYSRIERANAFYSVLGEFFKISHQ